MGVVTISASFGAGGSEIGPAVAKELGLPFVDRAIPAAVARKLGLPMRDVEAKDEKVERGLWRLISSMSLAPDLGGSGPLVASGLSDERAFRDQTEQVLRDIATKRGGVILGRAGAIVLADAPNALHVRLSGPEKTRIAQLAQRSGIAEKAAAQQVKENDSAREAYVKHLYRCDPKESRHYHLVVDTTAFPRDVVTETIVRFARERGAVNA